MDVQDTSGAIKAAEAPETQHVDSNEGLPNTLPLDASEYKALERKLVRKLDLRLMPVLVVMIILKYAIWVPMTLINMRRT
jgi:hypothetical protein